MGSKRADLGSSRHAITKLHHQLLAGLTSDAFRLGLVFCFSYCGGDKGLALPLPCQG